ncbi:hypothetical protein Slin14017_G037910 [Septoria linicola]|nr:hypothetical protein Slin14017_G037910 [Septoria linicola]
MSSLYERLQDNDQLLSVAMNDVAILKPHRRDGKFAIGTKDLNGCSTIVILDKGVILAHIAPMAPTRTATQASSGMEHFMAQAKAAVNLMQKNQDLFHGSTTTWGIFARVGADIPLDHYAAWLRRLFAHMDIPTQQAFYDVDPENKNERRLPTGSVVVLQHNGKPRLYLEDQPQTPHPQQSQASASQTLATVSAIAGPSTQSTRMTVSTSASEVQETYKHSGVYTPKASESASSISAPSWVFRESTFLLVQGGVVLNQQHTAPEKQPFFNEAMRLWMMKDGAIRMVHKDGVWARV